MKKLFALLISFSLGAAAAFLAVNFLEMDQLGRKDQALFTLLRILKENKIVITQEQAKKAIENIYPTEDIIQKHKSISVHKMEFLFIDNNLHEIKIH
jgi:hypothetical protein